MQHPFTTKRLGQMVGWLNLKNDDGEGRQGPLRKQTQRRLSIMLESDWVEREVWDTLPLESLITASHILSAALTHVTELVGTRLLQGERIEGDFE